MFDWVLQKKMFTVKKEREMASKGHLYWEERATMQDVE